MFSEKIREYKPRDYDLEMQYAAINGINICYTDTGKGDRTIVMVHGLQGSFQSFRDLIFHYSPSYRVIALDLPGHGNSERRNDIPYGIPLYSDIVKGLMDHLGVEKAVIMGTSMGGHTTAYFTWKNPERAVGIVLVDAAGLGTKLPGFVKGLVKSRQGWIADYITKNARKKAANNKQSLIDKLTMTAGNDGGKFPRFWDTSKPAVQEWIEGTNAYKKDFIWTDEFPKFNFALVMSMVSMMETPMEDKLAAIRIPTLIIWGDRDGMVPLKYGHAYKAGISGSSLVIIKNAGHMPYIEEPEQFHSAMEKFLADL